METIQQGAPAAEKPKCPQCYKPIETPVKRTVFGASRAKRQSTYTHWHVLLASPINPMPEKKRQFQLLRMYQGLAALEKGERPSRDDWAVCSDAVNLMETFVIGGIVDDSQGLVMDGITALAMAGRRHFQGGALRLDGPGIAAIRAVLEDYAELLAVLPERAVVACHRATEKRLHEILAGKRAAHDVEIITADGLT